MRCQIDITEAKTKTEQINLIFEGLMDRNLITEARIYSVIFSKLSETKKAPDLTYDEMCTAFISLREDPPTEVQFNRAIKNLGKVEIKFMDAAGQRRSVQLIKKV